MDDAILIIGAGVLQAPAIRIAKAMGLHVIATDVRPDAPGFRVADDGELLSKFDLHGHVALATRYAARFRLRGVMTMGTDVSQTVAAVAQALGLPGVSPETAVAATNKARMRERLKAHHVPCPDFVEVRSIEGAVEAAETLGYPVVIKPVDNMGARGVRRVDHETALRAAFAAAREHSRSGACIVEQYMEGPEVSIDTLVENGRVHCLTIADRHIAFPPCFVEIGHTIPSALPGEILDEVFDVMCRGIRALGIEHGPSKGDVKITKDGPKIGEMTARMSGGFHCQYTDPLATGMNSIKAAIDLAIGNPIDPADITPRWHRAAAERAILAEPGEVRAVEGIDEARCIDGVEHIFVNVSPGDQIAPLTSNIGKPGHVITSGATRDEAVAAAQRALDTVRILTSRNGHR